MKKLLGFVACLGLIGGCSTASTHGISLHSTHGSGESHIPTEVGQSAFAALAEIVAMLQQDKDTDWQQVSIDDLREHLVDMDLLTLRAAVTREQTELGQQRYHIQGDGRTLAAIQKMVPAHAAVISQLYGWATEVEITTTGAILEVKAQDKNTQAQLEALGFFGFMALGAHHQVHHLAIARGESIHGH